MRVLVTGSAGRIGKMQVKMLREAGHEVRTFDLGPQAPGEEGEHFAGDLQDIAIVREAVKSMDAVAHLGAIPSDVGAIETLFSINVQGTCNVLLACVEAGVGRVIYFSSVNALGNFHGYHPSEYLPIDDSYPRHPVSPYQISKHLGEEACAGFTRRYGLVTLCMRPVLVTEPKWYERWRSDTTHSRIEKQKNEYWAYVDVQDVCAATILALTVENVAHDAFLLTADDTSVEIPTAELVDRYYPQTPWPKESRAAYLADNAYRSLLDCANAKAVLGWQPKYSWRNSVEGK